MSPVVYLFMVVGLSLVGLTLLWIRNRPTSSPRSSVEQFNDKMKALSPDQALSGKPRRKTRVD
ncbi:MAG TPA: hypothetical protein VL068_03290 [Microthrixaceae bacterium]|nr:hypothetical protein [Microthrixaceae bacterium]